MATTKYPGVTVQLTGDSGNAILVIGKVQRALRNAGATPTEIDQFIEEATSGDYDKVLQTAQEWVEIR